MKTNGETVTKLGIAEAAYNSKETLMDAAVAMGETLARREWEGEVYAESIEGQLLNSICGHCLPKMCSIENRGKLFILTLTGNHEHWLNPSLVNSILDALSQVKAQATASPGSVLITTSQGKFFSNGLDLPWILAASSLSAARNRLNHMIHIFKPVVAQLLSFPMPTVVALSGHAAAAGLVLALSHDYVIMRSDRGVLYMSELDLGATLPEYFMTLAKSKIGSSSARRDVFLRGMKVRGEVAVRMGVVESAHQGEDGVMEAAVRLGEELAERNWDGVAYAEIRKSLYPEISGLLGLTQKVITISKL